MFTGWSLLHLKWKMSVVCFLDGVSYVHWMEYVTSKVEGVCRMLSEWSLLHVLCVYLQGLNSCSALILPERIAFSAARITSPERVIMDTYAWEFLCSTSVCVA